MGRCGGEDLWGKDTCCDETAAGDTKNAAYTTLRMEAVLFVLA